MIKIINMTIAFLLLNNFLYKNFIGVTFLEEGRSRERIKISLNMLTILLVTLLLSEGIIYIFPVIKTIAEAVYLINIFSVYFGVVIVNRFSSFEGRRAYYGVVVFLINLMISLEFPSISQRLIASILVPLFFYLNMVIMSPLLEKLKLENKKNTLNYPIIFIISMSIISMMFNAFIGY